MGESCCEKKCSTLNELVVRQRHVLISVLAINLIMFFVEFLWGIVAKSHALRADSLDMLGDALAYASSLYVLNLGLRAKIYASQFKASLMIFLALAVLAGALLRFINRELPLAFDMSIVATMALTANLFCLWLLNKHKNDDLNFQSVWLCSRNDIVANVSVIVASGLTFWLQSHWPDLIVALLITFLFLRSAFSILFEANRQMKASLKQQ
jgi:Co/Zn/Cd efflux system component